MTVACICHGPVCTCDAAGIVKDGSAIRRSVLAMDAAGATTLSIAERAASSRYDNVRGSSFGGMDAATYFAIRDAALEGDPVATARQDHSRDAWDRRVGDAWKNPNAAPSPAPAMKDDATSREAWLHRVSNAWRDAA